ncbi:hypothetical protein [Roseomonas indoligenes]|uniref:Uncharacterized protein n=1 Tax=Roseomonas indoligenes TaxID=2820811 RepID=A0A940S8V1_9PROT|nr:hypothetical protein [Pararoseomonas indoligenes]MBP0494578.1 hypothetical protein [Pararoseomonas indoligenes]
MDGMLSPGIGKEAGLNPDIRRIIAVEAHRRRAGRCPVLVHSLDTGESFVIEPLPDGFRDATTGLTVRESTTGIALDGAAAVDLRLNGDIAFEGQDHASGERFTGHAGGGASVTFHDSRRVHFFQYAISYRPDGAIAQPG